MTCEGKKKACLHSIVMGNESVLTHYLGLNYSI